MKLEDFIKELNKMHKKHGNVEVVINSNLGEDGYVDRIKDIKSEEVKQHQTWYLFLTKHLKTGGYCGGDAFVQPYQKEIEARPDIKVILVS